MTLVRELYYVLKITKLIFFGNISGCGNGKYLNLNPSIFNIGGEKCMRLSEIAKEKENEVSALKNSCLEQTL